MTNSCWSRFFQRENLIRKLKARINSAILTSQSKYEHHCVCFHYKNTFKCQISSGSGDNGYVLIRIIGAFRNALFLHQFRLRGEARESRESTHTMIIITALPEGVARFTFELSNKNVIRNTIVFRTNVCFLFRCFFFVFVVQHAKRA